MNLLVVKRGAPVAVVVAAEAVVDVTYVLVFVKERKETKPHEQAIVARITLATQVEKYFMRYFSQSSKFFRTMPSMGTPQNVFAM